MWFIPIFMAGKIICSLWNENTETDSILDKNELKRIAAEKAVDYIKDGMVLGLGTGSTVLFALQKLSILIREGKLKNIVGIPTSKQTEVQARELSIPLTTLSENPSIDLTIDGADEVDKDLNLIKGGGGALLREKIVAQATNKNIIIVDESKLSDKLGDKWPVPVEVIPFAVESEREFLTLLGSKVTLRINKNEKSFITDENNLILDCNFGRINNPNSLSEKLNDRAGIVEHGLFINIADLVISASENEIVELKK